MKFKLIEKYLIEDIESVKKRYPDIDDETFMTLIKFDPTYVEGRNSVGTYGKWILDRWKKGNITENNFGHLTDVLTRFEDKKNTLKIKDINKFKTVEELDDYLNDENNYSISKRQQKRQNEKEKKEVDVEQDAIHVFSDADWDVWIPKTYAASCRLGSGANWCTANTNSDYYYKYYKNERGGDYYINILKHDPSIKYQFHFESNQFMDRNDNRIDLKKFFSAYPSLRQFYLNQINEGKITKLNLDTCAELFGQEEARKMVETGKVTASVKQYFQFLGKDYALEKVLDGTLDISQQNVSSLMDYLPEDFFTNPTYFEAAKKYLNSGNNAYGVYKFFSYKRIGSKFNPMLKDVMETIAKAIDIHDQADKGNFVILNVIFGDKVFEDKYVLSKLPHSMDDANMAVSEILSIKPYRDRFFDNLNTAFSTLENGVLPCKVDAESIFDNGDFITSLISGDAVYEYFDSDYYNNFDNCYQQEDVGEAVEKKLTEMGLPTNVFSKMGDYEEYVDELEDQGEDVKYYPDDLQDAYARAYSEGASLGAEEAAYAELNSIDDQLIQGITVDWSKTYDKADGDIYLNVTREALNNKEFFPYLSEYFDNEYGSLDKPDDYIDAVKNGIYDYVRDNVEFKEPYNGFDGFSESAFKERLLDELYELQ